MAGWHHRLNGDESEETPGDREGRGGLACCGPGGQKESDMTEQHPSSTVISCVTSDSPRKVARERTCSGRSVSFVCFFFFFHL